MESETIIPECPFEDESGFIIVESSDVRHVVKITYPPYYKIFPDGREMWMQGGTSYIYCYSGEKLYSFKKRVKEDLDRHRRNQKEVMSKSYILSKKLKISKKRETDLLVVIDTLQVSYRNALKRLTKEQIDFKLSTANKWALNFKHL